jgi:GNAT superfamily N-acetyltransferase
VDLKGAQRKLGRASERLSRPRASIEVPIDCGSIVATPNRPSHRYGNLLVLDRAPHPDELGDWVALYREVAPLHGLPRAATIAWEEALPSSLTRYSTEDLDGRYELLYDDVLVYGPCVPEVAPPGVSLRVLEPEHWDALSGMAVPADGFVLDGTRDWLLSERHALVSSGSGRWWGAWDSTGTLNAACGAFSSGSLVRLDQLIVAPTARRKGIGSWLVHAIARQHPGRILAMEPAAGSWRSEIYQRVGYRPVGRTTVLMEVGSR